MTEPTHHHFDQVDADLADVLDALYRLMNVGEWDHARDTLRLGLGAAWADGLVTGAELTVDNVGLVRNPYVKTDNA